MFRSQHLNSSTNFYNILLTVNYIVNFNITQHKTNILNKTIIVNFFSHIPVHNKCFKKLTFLF